MSAVAAWRHGLAPGLVIYAFINRGRLKIKNGGQAGGEADCLG
jgi:hypothetical protein